MRALSFTRPWTSLVLSGVKTVENRSWQLRHRGWLVVHAAKSWDDAAITVLRELVIDGELTDADHDRLMRFPLDETAPTGFVGVVRVESCHKAGSLGCAYPRMCSPWAFDGSWHAVLSDARPFPEPIPGPGRLGLFDAPPEVATAARAAIEGVPS